MKPSSCYGLVLAIGLLTACSAPHPVTGLPPDVTDPGDTPLDPVLDRSGPGSGRLLIVTMSGGGKRAAAFGQGALNALETTLLPDGRSLLDEIDILSSTSGGSVTAAAFALNGEDGFDSYTADFLEENFMGRLYWELLNPVAFVSKVFVYNDRIEPLVEILEDTVFAKATLGDVAPRAGAPYLILNATDAASGLTFSMTQHYFDHICADSRPYPLSRAVAASASYPVLMSPIVLENKCSGQPEGKRRKMLANFLEGRLDGISPQNKLFVASDSPSERTRALRLLRLLEGEADARYVHLLDGGISDNLGLSEPLRLISSDFDENPYYDAVKDGPIKDLAILAVDARSNREPTFEETATPPSMFESLSSVLDGTIDSRMSGLAAQASLVKSWKLHIDLHRCAQAGVKIEEKSCIGAAKVGRYQELNVHIAILGFDNLIEPACRSSFAHLPTDWALTKPQVRALLDVGEGMVLIDWRIQRFAALAGSIPTAEEMTRNGLAKIEEACACFDGDDAPCNRD